MPPYVITTQELNTLLEQLVEVVVQMQEPVV
jgi:adenosylmethionine-8-amino-7-oxononanoate aminotransferase